MSFDWKQYLTLAEDLAQPDGKTNEEARIRCAVSRAYYAALGSARVYWATQGEFLSGHDQVINSFRDRSKVHNKAMRDLYKLKDYRSIADYITSLADPTGERILDRIDLTQYDGIEDYLKKQMEIILKQAQTTINIIDGLQSKVDANKR